MDANNEPCVKRRIPDATMGLRTYTHIEIECGHQCVDDDCNMNHHSKQPSEALLDYRMFSQMRYRQCGLVVDGIWGEANLVFPFAVYEAKKSVETWEQAEDQIFHAFQVYLAMLDDLARDPIDVTRYQSKENTRCQLFGFTSCGPVWNVYGASNNFNTCVSFV